MPRVVAIDTETTGLTVEDRIVTIGVIAVDLPDPSPMRAADGGVDVRVSHLHLVFDPGRKSHSRAEAVHGWDDWTLRHQDEFGAHAIEIRKMIDPASLVVAHNFKFDKGFVSREYTACRALLGWPRGACTMEMARAAGYPGALDRVAALFGEARSQEKHTALDDARLAMNLWMRLTGNTIILPAGPFAGPPTNYRAPPPRPARASNREKYAPRAELWRVVGPFLTLLVPIALADGAVTPDERRALSTAARAEAEAAGMIVVDRDLDDLVTAALAARPSADDISNSSRWYRDPSARERLATAANAVVLADGSIGREEIDVLRLVAEMLA